MADQRRKLVLSIYLLPLCIGIIFAQRDIIVEPREATVRNGDKVTLLCRSPRPLLYCRFEVPSMKPFRVSEDVNSDNPYYGNGLKQGDCGVQLNRVELQNNGKVNCTLGFADSNDEGIATIDLIVGIEPKDPHFEHYTNQELSKGSAFDDRCIVPDGRPAANITFFLNDQELVNGIGQPEEYQQEDKITVVRQIHFKVTDQDNGKILTCRAEHFAYPNGFKDTKVQLRVHYAPVPESLKTIYGQQLDRTAFITVTVQANPRPQTTWNINGQTQISEGDTRDGYEAQNPKEIAEGTWNVTLVIDRLTLEDTTKTYTLLAGNSLGRQEYRIKISPSDAPISDLDLGAIIGIIVACIIIIVIVGLIVVARITGRWCFAGASHNTDIGPDSEAQISPSNDEVDEKTHEHYHPDEHEDKEKKENGKHESNGKDLKTNTSV
jgi:hypothetical protein